MDIKTFANSFDQSTELMPALFCAHGSPMNALEDNEFTRSLTSMSKTLPQPKAVLCISAHWLTKGTYVNASPNPRMIYDMGGFPDELYKVQYPAVGSPEFAKQIIDHSNTIALDTEWGFDHGNWSIMRWLFPNADIPVFQLSLDYYKPLEYHYQLAKELNFLRSKGVMIIGSGNITHNLRMFNPNSTEDKVVDWAEEFDQKIKLALDRKEHKMLTEIEQFGQAAKLSVPEPSHYLPLLYIAGLQNNFESVLYPYEGFQNGSFSMRCVQIQS